ncbi:MAG: hypothetical protein ACR2FE_01320 [Aeromicrobium sp.]
MRDELADLGCTVIVSDPDVVALSVDKLATAEWSVARGLPFVRTHTLPDAQKHAGELADPVIVKPRRGSGSEGIRLARDSARSSTGRCHATGRRGARARGSRARRQPG